MQLNDIKVKKSKPEAKSYKMADGGGMYLEVMPNGSKYWRLKYRFAGKEKLLALGVYPEISLVEARQRRADARKLLAGDPPVDPGAAKQARKRQDRVAAANTFETVAREWIENRSNDWTEGHKALTSDLPDSPI